MLVHIHSWLYVVISRLLFTKDCFLLLWVAEMLYFNVVQCSSKANKQKNVKNLTLTTLIKWIPAPLARKWYCIKSTWNHFQIINHSYFAVYLWISSCDSLDIWNGPGWDGDWPRARGCLWDSEEVLRGEQTHAADQEECSQYLRCKLIRIYLKTTDWKKKSGLYR